MLEPAACHKECDYTDGMSAFAKTQMWTEGHIK